eukprot:1514724-Pleurochrysis_carterae.AAC.10
MRQQIQSVLRKAGEESSEKGTEEKREDLMGVEVNSVQQPYVNVRGMRTIAATSKCEFGYTTPLGKELRWGPTKFTLYAEYHKRSLKVKNKRSAHVPHSAGGPHSQRASAVVQTMRMGAQQGLRTTAGIPHMGSQAYARIDVHGQKRDGPDESSAASSAPRIYFERRTRETGKRHRGR